MSFDKEEWGCHAEETGEGVTLFDLSDVGYEGAGGGETIMQIDQVHQADSSAQAAYDNFHAYNARFRVIDKIRALNFDNNYLGDSGILHLLNLLRQEHKNDCSFSVFRLQLGLSGVRDVGFKALMDYAVDFLRYENSYFLSTA